MDFGVWRFWERFDSHATQSVLRQALHVLLLLMNGQLDGACCPRLKLQKPTHRRKRPTLALDQCNFHRLRFQPHCMSGFDLDGGLLLIGHGVAIVELSRSEEEVMPFRKDALLFLNLTLERVGRLDLQRNGLAGRCLFKTRNFPTPPIS